MGLQPSEGPSGLHMVSLLPLLVTVLLDIPRPPRDLLSPRASPLWAPPRVVVAGQFPPMWQLASKRQRTEVPKLTKRCSRPWHRVTATVVPWSQWSQRPVRSGGRERSGTTEVPADMPWLGAPGVAVPAEPLSRAPLTQHRRPENAEAPTGLSRLRAERFSLRLFVAFIAYSGLVL